MALWHPQNPIVRNLQAAFKNIGLVSSESCTEDVCRTVDEELWRTNKTRNGVPFESFPQWVAYRQPEGLGVSSQKSAEFLRKLLIEAGRVGIWAEILAYICLKQGRPEKLVDDEDFRPYYHVNTASNGYDRLLRHVMVKKPDIYAQVVAGELTVREAARKAGIIAEKPRGATWTIKLMAEFKACDGDRQVSFLDLLWSHMDVSTRQKFLVTREAP
jgi:hypothetical protein